MLAVACRQDSSREIGRAIVQDANRFQEILSAIKIALKNNGMTYRDLGEKLNIPESTIKKMFIAKDWPYRRLQDVCAVLNLDLADLLESVRRRKVTNVVFTPKQEDLFRTQPLAFKLYWWLVYERLPLAKFESQFHLSTQESFHLLVQLDKHELIELHPNNVIRVPDIQPARWQTSGPFITEQKQQWAVQTIKDAARSTDADSDRLIVQYFRLSPDSFNELQNAIRELEQEFARRTARDLSLHGKDLIRVRMALGVAEGSFLE